MRTSQLGSSPFHLTPVGLGTWAMGGGEWVSAWGAQDDQASINTIRSAVESGVNWVDTAGVYGLGHAEEVVAQALAPFSPAERPVVMTKGGMVWDEAQRSAPSRRVGTRQTLTTQVHDSLRRLGQDSLQVYFMHWPATQEPVEEYWQVLDDLRSAGTIQAIGLSNHSPEALQRAEALAHVDVVQPQLSAVVTAASRDVLPWAAQAGAGVVAYSPMASGLLSGSFSAQRVAGLPTDDWRRHSPLFTDDLQANLATARAVAEVAERHNTTPTAVAVAWVLGWAQVTGAIVGARSPQQVTGWLAGAELQLEARDYEHIGAGTPPDLANPGHQTSAARVNKAAHTSASA